MPQAWLARLTPRARVAAGALGIAAAAAAWITASGQAIPALLAHMDDPARRYALLLAAGLAGLVLTTWLVARSLRAQRAALGAMNESAARYRQLFNNSPVPLFVHADGTIRMLNPAALRLFQVADAGQMIGRAAFDHLHPDDRETARARSRAAIATGVRQPPLAMRYVLPNSRTIDVEFSSEPFNLDGEPAVLTSARDISGEMAAKRRLERTNQLYAALSAVNQAVVRATDYAALCEQVCRIAVEIGGMKCALVRRFDAERGVLVPVSFHGPATGLIGRHELPLVGTTGVSVEAANGSGRCVVHDMAASPITLHAADALAHGINSAAAFALRTGERLIGTFAVFGPGSGFFDDEMVALLQEIADSLAFARSKIVAEATLAQSERDLQLAQSGGRIGSVIIDLQQGTWTLSPVGCEVVGVAPGAWRPFEELEQLLAPETRGAAAARMRASVAAGRRTGEEYEIVRPADGTRAWIRLVADNEYGADGIARRRIGTVQDITAERAARMALARSEERFKLATAASGVAIWDWNIATGIAYLSDEYLRMFGYEPGAAIADLGFLLLLVHPEERSRTLRTLFQQWASGVAISDYEQRFVCKDGTVKWVQMRAQVVERDPDGRALRMVGTATDLTARKAYEERILRLSRLYGAISKTNDAVVRQPDFAALCAAACRIVVEEGGLVSATIRQHDTASDTLERLALHGPVGGMLGRARVAVGDARGVAPETFRRGSPVIVPDLAGDPLTRHARDDGAAHGIGAAACFPLREKGRTFGTFTVFAPDGAHLDAQTIGLLAEIAETLAFARAKFAADAALAASERDLALAQDAGRIGSIIIDCQSGIWTASRTGREILGLDDAQARAHQDFEPLLAPDAGQAAIQAWRAGLVSTERSDHTYSLGGAGSRVRRWVRMVTNTEFGGNGLPVRRIGIVQDVTAQVRAEQRIERLTRMYAALSSTNAAIVRSDDWNALCREVCRIIVEQGGVASAALRMPDARMTRLEVVAGFGPCAGAIGERAIALADDGTSVAVPVFRDGNARVINDFAAHPVASAWLSDAAPLHVNAAVVLPLRSGHRVAGVLSVYASTPGHFDGELARMLGDLADNLGFAHAKLANERAVAESEERFRALTMMASDWYWETDREHRFTRMSQGRQTDDGGFDAALMLGRTRWDFGRTVMDPAAERAHRDLLDRRAPFRDFEYRRVGPDGKVTIRCISGDPVFDAEGLFKGYRGVGRNVTVQRLAEEELRMSEQRYRTLFEASPDAIRVVADGRIVIVNPACVRLYGVASAEEIIGRSQLEFILPEHHAHNLERTRRVIEDGASAAPLETTYLRPDGSRVEVEVVTLPFNYNGAPAALSIIRDLSERNANQRALAEAERRYRSLVEASQGGILLLAGDVVAYANPGLGAMLGFARQEDIPGTSLYSLVLLESHEALRGHLRRLSAHANQAMARQDLRMRRRDGETISVTATATSIDLDGQTMIQMELRDVTRERLAMAQVRALNETLEARIDERTRELTRANNDLETANRDLESFSYSVAHDLRAPLRSMAGFASLLEMDVAAGALGKLPAHTARIMQNAARMNALIDGLLAVARVTHGELKDEEVDFARLVGETIRESHPGPAVQIEVDALPVVRGDISALRQVWANLMANAIKYSAKRAAPRVHVGVEERESELVFHVRDNGAGFDPSYSQRLFGVFQRLHSSHDFEGTGVGLAVVRRVIERHGGHVWAEGRPDQGATFYFTLPAARRIPRQA